MPSNYDGNPTSTQAPASAPGDAVAVKMALPVDGDLRNVSSIYQSLKVAADWIAFLRDFKSTFTYTTHSATEHSIRIGNFRILIEEFEMDTVTPGAPVLTVHTFATAFGTTLAAIPIPQEHPSLALAVGTLTTTTAAIIPQWLNGTTYDAPYGIRLISIGLVA